MIIEKWNDPEFCCEMEEVNELNERKTPVTYRLLNQTK